MALRVGNETKQQLLGVGQAGDDVGLDVPEDAAEERLCDKAVPGVGVPVPDVVEALGEVVGREHEDNVVDGSLVVLVEELLDHRADAVGLVEAKGNPDGLAIFLGTEVVAQLLLLENERLLLLLLLLCDSVCDVLENVEDRVSSSAEEFLSVSEDGSGPHSVKVFLECVHALARPHCPELDQAVRSCAEQLHSRGEEGGAEHGASMAFEGAEAGVVGERPDADRSVRRARDNALVNWREVHTPDATLVALQCSLQSERVRLPHLHHSILASRRHQ
mmetsp:Transcript_9960/g.40320  ORF Transcript_9960/g.40320 Transcript_9960/m.40320 type:complete len:275 (+) Transcript_9960:352-1176(+)